MITLNNKDADFIAGIIRELIKTNNEVWSNLCSKHTAAEQLAKTLGKGDSKIEEQFNKLQEVKSRAEEKYNKRSAEYERALLLCMAGSEDV